VCCSRRLTTAAATIFLHFAAAAARGILQERYLRLSGQAEVANPRFHPTWGRAELVDRNCAQHEGSSAGGYILVGGAHVSVP